MLDSLKHVKTLENSGFSRSQAESQVQVLTNVVGGSMVTKEEFRNGLVEQSKDFKLDMANLRQGFKSDMAKFREEIRSSITALREEIFAKFENYLTAEQIKDEFAKSEQRMTIKLGKMMFFHFMAMVGVLAIALPVALKYLVLG